MHMQQEVIPLQQVYFEMVKNKSKSTKFKKGLRIKRLSELQVGSSYVWIDGQNDWRDETNFSFSNNT